MATVLHDHVAKRFGDVVAVGDMVLEMTADREFLILVATPGRGNTTTLRLVAGLQETNKGQIFLNDRLVNDVPPHTRGTVIVFQNCALYPHMPASENMGFDLKVRVLSKAGISQRVEETGQLLGIANLSMTGNRSRRFASFLLAGQSFRPKGGVIE